MKRRSERRNRNRPRYGKSKNCATTNGCEGPQASPVTKFEGPSLKPTAMRPLWNLSEQFVFLASELQRTCRNVFLEMLDRTRVRDG
jgi:hypothetical protein